MKNNLKILRKEKGMSQKELADILHVAQNTISQWENGTRPMDAVTVLTVSDYFGVSTDYLLGNAEAKAAPSVDITFDDFTYALLDEAGPLSDENKKKLLDMARAFAAMQEKEEKEKKG